jgi:hypothetical protein
MNVEAVLGLAVEVRPGTEINEAFSESSRLASQLSLAWVTFDFNGDKCTAYESGSGHAYRDGRVEAGWTATGGIKWK